MYTSMTNQHTQAINIAATLGGIRVIVCSAEIPPDSPGTR